MSKLTFTVEGPPIGKPRMTRSDKWKKRDCVLRYWAWADACRLAAKAAGSLPEAQLVTHMHVEARLAMPASWAAKRRAAMAGQPHRQKPDADNIGKSAMDSLWEEDSAIWSLSVRKLWDTGSGSVTVTVET